MVANRDLIVEERIPTHDTSEESEKPAGDWRETLNHILTLGLIGVVVVILCTGCFYAGGYFLKPTYNQAKADMAADPQIGDDRADSYFESTDLCPDGTKHRKACRLLIKDATHPAPRLASAVEVPGDKTASN